MKALDKSDSKYVYDVASKNIKKIRLSKGLTQAKLAELCFYNVGSIANIENRSETTFSLEMLML
jgi:transcriptional regulator with XRE-family HTH domain